MDKVYIYDENNNRIEMEVVTIFKFANSLFNYIIYTDNERKKYYTAKYVNDIGELNTDFSDKELQLCNKILEGVI